MYQQCVNKKPGALQAPSIALLALRPASLASLETSTAAPQGICPQPALTELLRHVTAHVMQHDAVEQQMHPGAACTVLL